MAVNVAVTGTRIYYNTGTVCTKVQCAADTETLTYTPTKGCETCIIVITDVSGSGTAIDFDAGDYWASMAMTQVTVAAGTSRAFILESARYKNYVSGASDDTIVVKIGTAANTNWYQFIELPRPR